VNRIRASGGIVAAALGVVLMTTILATVGFGLASAAPANAVHHRFKLLEPYDQQSSTYVDLGDPGLSQGDLGTYAGEIYNANGTVHVGYENSECVVGVIGEQTFQFVCSGYFVLKGGQITMQGTIVLGLDEGLGAIRSPGGVERLEFHWAITGGTDRYESVSGQMNWGGDDPNNTILLFDLTR
jgi:hypothetical protein